MRQQQEVKVEGVLLSLTASRQCVKTRIITVLTRWWTIEDDASWKKQHNAIMKVAYLLLNQIDILCVFYIYPPLSIPDIYFLINRASNQLLARVG